MIDIWNCFSIFKTGSNHRQVSLSITVCYYHVTYAFRIESTLYKLSECQETPCSKQAQ